MSLLGTPGTASGGDRRAEAARQLETLVLKQMLTASGAFKAGATPGASLHTDLFVDALADAVTRAGGIGLANQLLQAMGGSPGGPRGVPSSGPDTAGALLPGSSAVVGGPATLSSGFGPRSDPFDGHLAQHAGVDLAAPGGTEVRAAAGGVVRHAGDQGGYGLAVELDHGGGVTTIYGHTSELLVRDGEKVEAGQPIARVGHTGRATGDHLHFELRRGGVAVNPTTLLKAYAGRAEEKDGRPKQLEPPGSRT